MKFSEEWWVNYAHPENRCVAHRKNGDQCRHPARRGATVCRVHGGGCSTGDRKARERISLAADRMARELLGIATGAESEAVKLAAVKDALDRAGLGAKTEVALELKPWEAHHGRRGRALRRLPAQKAEHGAGYRTTHPPRQNPWTSWTPKS